jgi:C4-dicarboxylate-specific signal transduction histidine kinase
VQAVGTLGQAGLEGRAGEAARQLDLFVNSLRNELRLFGQLRYVQRSQRSQRISVREITEFLLLARDPELSAAGIKLDPWMEEDLTVFMSEAAVAQVIGNILDNAIYWLGQAPAGVRKLRVDLDPVERTLVIANNGPEVSPVVRDRLFERPFVTMKEEGHGLGLYLSAEIMKRAGGSLAMLPEEEAPLEGPAFVLRFPAAE